ncbi:CoA transferase [Streptomyces sp. NPDC093984]|uniref:CoA transferase n=1 Tax=Streptomyces sp. NPDC093984 TaxID=3366052 RepID=UPI0037FC7BBF
MTEIHMAGPLESMRVIDLSTVVLGSRRTPDGLAAVTPYNPQSFRHVFSAARRPDLAADPRVDGSALDLDDVDDSSDLVDEALTTVEWAEVRVKHSIPTGPVLQLDHTQEDSSAREGYLLDPVARPPRARCRRTGFWCGVPPRPALDTAHVLA